MESRSSKLATMLRVKHGEQANQRHKIIVPSCQVDFGDRDRHCIEKAVLFGDIDVANLSHGATSSRCFYSCAIMKT